MGDKKMMGNTKNVGMVDMKNVGMELYMILVLNNNMVYLHKSNQNDFYN
ncbi:MAG: hypothetical protein ACI4L1_01980 [Christensenellales bacterium]